MTNFTAYLVRKKGYLKSAFTTYLGHIFLQIPLKNPTSYLVEAGF